MCIYPITHNLYCFLNCKEINKKITVNIICYETVEKKKRIIYLIEKIHRIRVLFYWRIHTFPTKNLVMISTLYWYKTKHVVILTYKIVSKWIVGSQDLDFRIPQKKSSLAGFQSNQLLRSKLCRSKEEKTNL